VLFIYFLCCSNPWATLTGSSTSVATNLSPTAELDPLLSHLSSTLGFLSRALASAPLRRITRAVLGTISNVIWENVLSRHRFSTAGAAQLQADLAAICRVVDAAAGSGVAEAGLRKCLQGAQLVGLPVKGGKSQVDTQGSVKEDGGEDWEAWGGEVADSTEVESNGATRIVDGELGLWEVEKRLFADNRSAREVLDDLGMDLLSESEARAVLGRRVELAG
jgi:hypothetical protein